MVEAWVTFSVVLIGEIDLPCTVLPGHEALREKNTARSFAARPLKFNSKIFDNFKVQFCASLVFGIDVQTDKML